mgnify:FL=1
MKFKIERVGMLSIQKQKLDITDPGYDKDVWCRLERPIFAGEYNCFIGKGKYNIIYALILLSKDIDLDDKRLNVTEDGIIGVDSGTAGFFVNKPDYSDEEWSNVCKYLFGNQEDTRQNKNFWLTDERTPLKCQSFFSFSGMGDGEYGLYRLTKNRKLVGYKLVF